MSAPPPKDPRFRPFRAVSWAVYLVVAVGFSSLIIYSVFRSVLNMTPSRPPSGGPLLAEAECVTRARALFDELERERRALTEVAPTRQADQRFLKFRVDWHTRQQQLESQCAAGERPRLKRAFATLDRLLDLYTTATVQFSGAVGPAVDELRRQLDGAE